jgi:putative sterol carrier protein
MYVDLWHGKCRGCEIVTDPDKFKPQYILAAPYTIWKQIATKKLDSTKALITKQSKLTGDMAKVMRYTKAANELTNATMTIQTEWLD